MRKPDLYRFGQINFLVLKHFHIEIALVACSDPSSFNLTT